MGSAVPGNLPNISRLIIYLGADHLIDFCGGVNKCINPLKKCTHSHPKKMTSVADGKI